MPKKTERVVTVEGAEVVTKDGITFHVLGDLVAGSKFTLKIEEREVKYMTTVTSYSSGSAGTHEYAVHYDDGIMYLSEPNNPDCHMQFKIPVEVVGDIVKFV